MVNGESTMKIDMEVRSDDLGDEDLPDAELHLVYRRLSYTALLHVEEKFIADPLRDLVEAGRKMAQTKAR